MKHELPIAVMLLAAGSLLCFSHLAKDAPVSDGLVAQNQTPTLADDSVPPMMKPDFFTRQNVGEIDRSANKNLSEPARPLYKGPLTDSPIYQPQSQPTHSGVMQASFEEPAGDSIRKPMATNQAASSEAIAILEQASNQIAGSQPFRCGIELNGHVFEQSVKATGSYYQMGQGTSKSRVEFDFGSNAPKSFQICDGRFVYKLQIDGDQRSFEFVDLMRIRDSSGESTDSAAGVTPTGWVATGGLASLFQHLASAFNFSPPELDGENTVTMRGGWNQAALTQVLDAGSDSNIEFDPTQWPLTPEQWTKLPNQLPHAIELTFKSNTQLGNQTIDQFPATITFLQYNAEGQIAPAVSLVFSTPEPLAMSAVEADRLFQIDSSNIESMDLTNNYITRIQSFNESQKNLQATHTDQNVDR